MFQYAFTVESDGERILKINQNLAKLWAIKYHSFLMKHSVLEYLEEHSIKRNKTTQRE